MFVVSDKLVFLITSVLAQALRVITTFVMARLLTPEDYGLLALVGIAPGFLALLGDCGITRALVQYRDLPTETVEASGLMVSVALAIFYAALFFASGVFFFLHGYKHGSILVRYDQRMVAVGLIAGMTVILSAIYTFQMACLNRDLKFRAEALQNLIFAVVLAVTGLSLALVAHHHRPFGVFAVAGQPLVAQIMGNAVIYHRHPFRWPSAFRFSMAAKMLNYGWRVTLAQYANNLQQTIVAASVSVVGGAYGLGVFGRATQVSDMIGYSLVSSFDRLLHPLLRSVRDDAQRLRGIFTRGCIGTTLLCGFGWAWLMGTAPDLIRVVMGPQWGAVPPLLRIVCTVLLTSGAGLMAIVVTHALGKPLVWLRFGSVNLALLLAALASGLSWHRSLAAIAAAYAACQATTAIAMNYWAARTLRVSVKTLGGHLARLLAVSLVTGFCILQVRHWILWTPAVVRLIVASLAGAAVFLILALLVEREAILDFRTLVRRRRPAEPPPPQTTEVPPPQNELWNRRPEEVKSDGVV